MKHNINVLYEKMNLISLKIQQLISGSSNSGKLYDFATGSYFSPYVTTVGLYDN
jgi:hypothetical protein